VSCTMVGGADVGRWFCCDTENLSCSTRTCKLLHATAACLTMQQVHLCLHRSSAFKTRHSIWTVLLTQIAVDDLDRDLTPCRMSHAASRSAMCNRSKTLQLRPGCLFLSSSGDLPDPCPSCLAA
jgi:hypothetical protein